MLYDSNRLYIHSPELSVIWWYGEFFPLSQEQNEEASWLLAVGFSPSSAFNGSFSVET